jgi:hypothetical protein
MKTFEERLCEYADGNYDCALYKDIRNLEGYNKIFLPMKKIEEQLIERDKKLVEALRSIYTLCDGLPSKWAKEALESIGEDV